MATLGTDAAEAVQKWSVLGSAEAVSGAYRETQAGDGCVKCDGGKLAAHTGIELGHVFYLGTKYSAPLNAVLTGPNGTNNPIEMGCYGLGMVRAETDLSAWCATLLSDFCSADADRLGSGRDV